MGLRRRGYKPVPMKVRNRTSKRPSGAGAPLGSKKKPIPKDELRKVYNIFAQSPGRKFNIAPTHRYYRAVLSLAARGKIARQGNTFWLEPKR